MCSCLQGDVKSQRYSGSQILEKNITKQNQQHSLRAKTIFAEVSKVVCQSC